MTNAYYETRRASARGSDSLAADITRHMHARQQLGRIIIICDQPIPMLSAIRKQWLRLSRTIQRQRSATLNADKILKYTHTITRMQHMRFTTKPIDVCADGDVYCLRPAQAQAIPVNCYTVYLTTVVDTGQCEAFAHAMPRESLIVDYVHGDTWDQYRLRPKRVLEQQAHQEWQQLLVFLERYHIHPAALHNGVATDILAMDTALDTLLDVGQQFLQRADAFHHALSLARPLRLDKNTRLQHDAVVLLAHRVQALGPGEFSQRFLDAYNEDDTFFLYDSGKFATGETLRERYCRYYAQGHIRLAHAMLRRFAR